MIEWLKGVLGKHEPEGDMSWINEDEDGDGLDAWLSEFEIRMSAAHEMAVSKGFWEEDRPDTDAIALMHSELSEMLEYLRKGNGASDKIPSFDGASEEGGDFIVRSWDTCKKRGYNLVGGMMLVIDGNGEGLSIYGDWVSGFNQLSDMFTSSTMIGRDASFATDIGAAHRLLDEVWDACLDVHDSDEMGKLYAEAVCFIMAMGAKHQLHIAEAIDAKMEYNRSRPHKHGKAF